jgi:3-deoxy-D-manno-octulosonic-acid transferase
MWAYTLGVRFWEWLIRRAAAWHAGAAGRSNMLLDPWPENAENKDLIWFHCASLGEYEQILPVIQCWESKNPRHQILISFYSASGYQIAKPTEKTRWVVGFPGDIKPALHAFLLHFKPKLAVFTKAEIWPLCLHLLNLQGIPSMLVAFSPGRSKNLARWPARFVLNQMQKLAYISCQDEETRIFLTELGLKNAVADGDPRVERTLALQSETLDWPEHLCWRTVQPLVVLGSVWAADLDLWEPIVAEQTHVNWIIAPHQWTEDLKKRFQEKFPQAQHWSSEKNTSKSNVVVLDVVGVLSRLYRFANAAYVGGGFGRGVHSVLEPAAAGIPVAFGPKHKNSLEAMAFLQAGAGSKINNPHEALNWLKEVEKETVQHHIKNLLQHWFEVHSGASQKIAQRMEKALNPEQ